MNKKSQSQSKAEKVRELIGLNFDARQYFFTKADEQLLGWLWANGLLDAIKEKPADQTRYWYRTPELHYLATVAKKEPAKVVDIMLQVPISPETFSPEVTDRFLRICVDLPADQLSRLVTKIRDEKWVNLMGGFNQWGFEYNKMLQTLAGAKDYNSMLVLAEAMLAVRPKKEVAEIEHRWRVSENCFYIKDLSETGIFDKLTSVDDQKVDVALGLAVRTIGAVINLGDPSKDKEFSVDDHLCLIDVDFFSLKAQQKKYSSDREDMRELAVTIKVLTQRLIGNRCDKVDEVRSLYTTHFNSLPDSQAVWRLRLFVLSLCPKVFASDLKTAFYKIFETEKYQEYTLGAEFSRALRAGFSALAESDQRNYVKQVLAYFGQPGTDKEKNEPRKHSGWKILSSIYLHLTDEEKAQCERVFGRTCDEKYEPEPAIGTMRGGSVRPRGPITPEEFGELPISEIANNLRTLWTPQRLREQNTGDDFLNPLNAEGAGDLFKNDIPKRLQDYANDAKLFFERDVLDQNYTYAFMRGLQEAIHANREEAAKITWEGLITLLQNITEAGTTKPFDQRKRERSFHDGWLTSWDEVHSVMADVIKELLSESGGHKVINYSKHRADLLPILSYLLAYPDPVPADEKIETATSTTTSPGEETQIADPFSMAINSVRGRAFEVLPLIAYLDGKRFSKEDQVKISPDVKQLYETTLSNENTRAVMFLFGHYLPTFYFRDKVWIGQLLPQIFPDQPEKEYLYTAAWEGYLANNLYEELFFDPAIQKIYERGLVLPNVDDLKQKRFKEPDEGIASHFGLAFMYYEGFGFDHPLLTAFWSKNDPEQHADFISFLGRAFVSGDNAQANELLKNEPRAKARLIEVWDWMLEHYTDIRPLTEFGVWINLRKNIFDTRWLAEHIRKTLEKTKGKLDWDYGLMMSIEQLAKLAPEDTLIIARLYLLEGGVRTGGNRAPIHLDQEWFEAMKTLYGNSSTRSGSYALINDLVQDGGITFWKLKEVIND
ncbi:MAG: hypothetical protein HYR90_00850 [Candidatus Andersenbacteria bacterium]|nr:hypothetical protein [Candidatus Andersenbacteria bacterium]MBI3251203.1 hypothetical protein [Candidatus Andersenbacteria bacterium]